MELEQFEIKSGRMISKRNADILRQVTELVMQLIPEEAQQEPEEMPAEKSADTLVAYGGAVKSLPGGGLGGNAVTYGGQDLTGDTFGRETNYGFAGADTKNVDILFHHAQPIETKTGKSVQVQDPIGRATLRQTDDGVIIEEAILFNAERYAKHLGKLGWSTGAASHSVVREGGQIKQWQIAELSLTPTPAEPRQLMAAKSLAGERFDFGDDPTDGIDFTAIGREVGKEIAKHMKHLEGQHDQSTHGSGGGGGGSSGGEGGSGGGGDKDDSGKFTGTDVKKGETFGRNNSRVGMNGGEYEGEVLIVGQPIQKMYSKEETVYRARIEGISGGQGNVTVRQSQLENNGKILKNQEPQASLARIQTSTDQSRFN